MLIAKALPLIREMILISIEPSPLTQEKHQTLHLTQISTRPRATKQGRIKCRRHSTVPTIPTQGAILEEGGIGKKTRRTKYFDSIFFQVTCYCGRPFAGRPMIECTRCLTWVHLKWDLKSGNSTIWNPDKWPQLCQKPFEIWTNMSGFWMVQFPNGWDYSYSHG